MRGTVALTIVLTTAALVSPRAKADTAQDRLGDASEVLTDIMSTPDKGIPQDLLAKAQCVVVVPSLKKGAFVVGGEYGRGFATCRRPNGVGWSAPEAIRVEGGSVGFQIGGSATDVVMLVMNERGMNKLLGDKFTLGADASVAAGPVGRTADASTDARMTAEILTWSRSKGLFAGVALKGATLRPDEDQNKELYGRKVDPKDILTGSLVAPPSAKPFIAELDKYSVHKEGTSDRSVHQ